MEASGVGENLDVTVDPSTPESLKEGVKRLFGGKDDLHLTRMNGGTTNTVIHCSYSGGSAVVRCSKDPLLRGWSANPQGVRAGHRAPGRQSSGKAGSPCSWNGKCMPKTIGHVHQWYCL